MRLLTSCLLPDALVTDRNLSPTTDHYSFISPATDRHLIISPTTYRHLIISSAPFSYFSTHRFTIPAYS